MKNIGYLLLISAILFSSCIKEEIEPCPALHVSIAVKDKNYFNVDKVALEKRKSEDLAFKEYVPTLYYRLCDAVTGEVVEEQGVFDVTGEDKTFPITFCDCIPHGKYVLTVWGGLKDNTPLGSDPLTAILHAEEAESDDFYLTNDTLIYDAWNYDYTVDMERAKGKLIVQVENLPEDVHYSDKTVDGLYLHLDCNFNYSDRTKVYTQAELNRELEVVTKTLLSPSSQEKGSVLKANFYDHPDRAIPVLTPKAVNITMKRNELTVLKYVYEGGDFLIYLLVNDNWEMLHGMEID